MACLNHLNLQAPSQHDTLPGLWTSPQGVFKHLNLQAPSQHDTLPNFWTSPDGTFKKSYLQVWENQGNGSGRSGGSWRQIH